MPERRFERIASERRKAVSAHDRFLPDVADQLNNDLIKETFSGVRKEHVSNPKSLALLQLLDQSSEHVKLCPFLSEFSRQTRFTNLYDFLVGLKFRKTLEIDTKFFSELHVDARDLFREASRLDLRAYDAISEGKDWDNASETFKNHFSDNLARHLSAKNYGLQVSSWRPNQPIENLIKELQEHGPLAIEGCFGRPHYSVPARKLGRQIEGREIYGWLKSDPKNPGIVTGHMILIVGAERAENRGFVYFIDPMDDSDPQHPEKQRIYVMSYDRLTASDSICDLHGFVRTDAPLGIGYAYCRKKP